MGIYNPPTIRAPLSVPVIGSNGFLLPAASLAYLTPCANKAGADEDIVSWPVPYAMILKNLTIRTNSAQPADGDLVFTVRKNGVATALLVTIPGGSAGAIFSDNTHSVLFSIHDLLTIEAQNNDLDEDSATITAISLEAEAAP